MQIQLTTILEELQRQAKLCETIAQDKTEAALTGAPSEKEKNELEAKEWLVKSQVWLEAGTVVRAGFDVPVLTVK